MNTNIRLMEEIEKNMEVGENFYSLAVKMPLNSVIKLLLEGHSFIEAFQKQDDILNIICAEQDYLSLNRNSIDIYFSFKKIEVNFVKRIAKMVKKDIDFTLKDISVSNSHNTELDKKLIQNFEELKKDIRENKSRWLLKCLAFKQFRTTINRENHAMNTEMANRVEVLNKVVA